MLKTSVIIPTFNREKELRECIRSIIAQTVKPSEIIIIDDGGLAEPPLEEECRRAGMAYVYFRKDRPGLTESRNAGISMAKGEIIFFFDDDVVLFEDFMENILTLYEKDPAMTIGGIGGFIVNIKPLSFSRKLRKVVDIMFLNSGLREGRVLPSGFCSNFGETLLRTDRTAEVDFLPGCAMSFRRDVFHDLSFSDGYRNYGLGEDKDFSFQVAGRYRLLVSPDARLFHNESPAMRPDMSGMGRKFVMGRYLFFTHHVRKHWWDWAFFWYALCGYIVVRTLILILSPGRGELDKLRGTFSAVRDIARGDVKLPRKTG